MSNNASQPPGKGPQGPDELPVGIVLVTSASGERRNVMTATRLACVSPEPLIVSLAVHRDRYTYGLIKESGEFVLNVASRALAAVALKAGLESGRTIDKFATYGLETRPATYVAAPLIVNCASSTECKVIDALDIEERTLFIAKMLALHVNEGVRPLVSFQHRFWEVTEALPIPS